MLLFLYLYILISHRLKALLLSFSGFYPFEMDSDQAPAVEDQAIKDLDPLSYTALRIASLFAHSDTDSMTNISILATCYSSAYPHYNPKDFYWANPGGMAE